MDFQDFEDKENLPPAHSDSFSGKSSKKSIKVRKNKELTIAEKARVLRNRVQNKYNEWVVKSSIITETLEKDETVLADHTGSGDENMRF